MMLYMFFYDWLFPLGIIFLKVIQVLVYFSGLILSIAEEYSMVRKFHSVLNCSPIEEH